ncbi:hypothetical protein C7416_104436 [Cupriavidus phytorum]|uniref:Uncharacterized protein n=1 Tax=Cupriavidus phytorum TaxID=3024399 RepID=A0A2W7P018_9BURK|nr:hypothetical protein [Cupriavidus alkaliphilus]PZX29431.1 hypothetical protein C7416_104436 [Cupriavidus alkaliphilus]
MSNTGWVDMSLDTVPPEGEVVMTRDSGGHEQPLKRMGNLFFFPDMSMYVYYVPRAWRELTDAECDAEITKLEAKAAADAESSRRSIEAMRATKEQQ